MPPRLPLFCSLLLILAACSPTRTLVKHLGPLPESGKSPTACELISVLPDSPASKAGIQVGEIIVTVNKTTPTDAAAVSDLIQASGSHAELEIKDDEGKV